MEGYVEHITKSYEFGGREFPGYIVLVRIPGVDTFEVGLAPLRKQLGISKLTPHQVKVLMEHKPETISFHGKYHEFYNDLKISEESAQDWADRVRHSGFQGLFENPGSGMRKGWTKTNQTSAVLSPSE